MLLFPGAFLRVYHDSPKPSLMRKRELEVGQPHTSGDPTGFKAPCSPLDPGVLSHIPKKDID